MFRNVVDDCSPDLRNHREYLVASYGENIARTNTRSFANVMDAIVAAGGDIMCDCADQIICAVLLIVGQQDFIISKAQIDKLAGHIRRAETIEVEATGHGIHDERPQWLAETVARQ